MAGVERGHAIARPRLVSAVRTGTGRYLIGTTIETDRFAIIGAGRLGASLALALRARGASIVGFIAGSPGGRSRAQAWLGAPATSSLAGLVDAGPDVYLVAVPDRSLPTVAQELADALPFQATSHGRRPIVAHTSGATSVTVLDPCRVKGAATLVFHPLQTFSDPTTGWRRLVGTAVAITPTPHDDDRVAFDAGIRLAEILGARPFLLGDDRRGLYHAAATVACNYMVTLEHAAERLFVEAGLPAGESLSMFLPLVRATLDNIEEQGTVEALTGPLSRGDCQTVAGHLAALERHAPAYLALYRVLGTATLALVRAQSNVDETLLASLARLLDPDAQAEGRSLPASDARSPAPDG